MKIDLHTHFLPPKWDDWANEHGGARWPRLEHLDSCSANMIVNDKVFRRVTDQCWLPERRIEDMDSTGVDIQVISPVPIMLSYWAEPLACQTFARMQNEYCADIVSRHPKRFMGMATVPLQDPALAITELRHAVEQLGLRAVEIGTFPGGRDFDSPELFPFFEACVDLGVSVFVHPADAVIGKERMGDYYLPNILGNPLETALAITRFIFGGVAERLPALKICFAHGGGAFAFVLGRVHHGWNLRAEPKEFAIRPPVEYARQLYFDSITHGTDNLRFLIDKFGPDRVVLGSDYPFALGELDPVAFVDSCGLDAETIHMIGETNALNFLGIDDLSAGRG
ncbi:MAG: amidohydrolase family protein [Rhodospirillales bacterium]|nr:amidohydrolase family protein [Rhodospirillales bacterium]